MSQDLIIREASPEDLPIITRFNRFLALETEKMPLAKEQATRGVKAVLDDPQKGFYLLAWLDGGPVGQVLITREWSDWRAGWFWWLQSAYVSDDVRRQGVFRALYDAVLARAEERDDVFGLRLYLHESNRKADKVYARLGFAETEYTMRSLRWVKDITISPQER